MKLRAITCEQCSAPLEVPAKATSAKCGYCNSLLHLDQPQPHALKSSENDSSNLDTIRLQNELERLDREWMMKRESFMIKGKNGEMSIPDTTMLVASGFGIVFAGFWTLFTLFVFPPFALFGGFMIFLIITQTAKAKKKMEQYKVAHSQYRRKRQEILSQLHQEDPPGIDNYLQDLSFN